MFILQSGWIISNEPFWLVDWLESSYVFLMVQGTAESMLVLLHHLESHIAGR
jgi:hypothetical protein